MLFGYLHAKYYHEIGFRASERPHQFCILHFAFCIFKLPDKPQLKHFTIEQQETGFGFIIAQAGGIVKAVEKKHPGVGVLS